jgi:hypothetical protein
MRFSGGPTGIMVMLIGLALTGGASWAAAGSPQWTKQMPAILMGLALVSFGYSMVNRSRKARSSRD